MISQALTYALELTKNIDTDQITIAVLQEKLLFNVPLVSAD